MRERPWLRPPTGLMRLALAAIFTYAGLSKVLAPGELRAAIVFLGWIPNGLILSCLVGLLVGVELWIGCALILMPTSRLPLWGVMGYLVAVSGVYVVLQAQGFSGDCGCSLPVDGVLGAHGVLVRNGALLVIAIASLAGSAPRTPVVVQAR